MTARVDPNGWKVRPDTPLSRVGVFPYLGREIPGAPNPDQIYMVLRPEDELSDPECVESFKLAPWVNEHTFVGPKTDTPAEQKGIHGTIGEQVYYKDGVLYGNVKVFSSSLESMIQEGKRELSLGYYSTFVPEQGVYAGERYDYVQREIRGNHLASVEAGRMGPGVAVADGKNIKPVITLDSKEFVTMPEENDPLKKPEGGEGGSDMSLSELTAAIKQILPVVADLQKVIAAMTPAAPVEPAAAEVEDEDDAAKASEVMDAQIKDLKGQIENMRKEGTRAVMAELSKRDALVSQLKPHVGVFDHAPMTYQEVVDYGAEKLQLDVKGQNAEHVLSGYLRGLGASKTAKVGDAAADAKAAGAIDSYLEGKK